MRNIQKVGDILMTLVRDASLVVVTFSRQRHGKNYILEVCRMSCKNKYYTAFSSFIDESLMLSSKVVCDPVAGIWVSQKLHVCMLTCLHTFNISVLLCQLLAAVRFCWQMLNTWIDRIMDRWMDNG